MTIPRLCLAGSSSTQSGIEEVTCEDGQNSLVDGLDLPRLKHVTGEQCYYKQHDKDEERP